MNSGPLPQNMGPVAGSCLHVNEPQWFHGRRDISWLDEKLLASQEELSSTEWTGCT
jgi:hypothetical protein